MDILAQHNSISEQSIQCGFAFLASWSFNEAAHCYRIILEEYS